MENKNNKRLFSKVHLLQFLLAFFLTALGIVTAYYTTIAGIRIDLAKKAESNIVNQLDKKISQVEIILDENFMSKKDFYEFKEEMDKRLTRIEYRLGIEK
jgi:hypothetical protein